jgi:hypothetical protein
MSRRARVARGLVVLSIFLFALLCVSYASPGGAGREKKDKDNMVYVCACMKTKSCSCMTMAKTPGFCACGPKGGPALKAVPRDSDWAKENRDALAN